jgi:POT family proton-dependent oligopeptide transporter
MLVPLTLGLAAVAAGVLAIRRPAAGAYPAVPVETEKMPSGIPYIVANEGAERWSYYGMKAILVVFMTKFLVDSNGQPAPMSEGDAKSIYHLFNAAVYFTPVLGAILADWLFGKYRVIMLLSVVYCLGHLALAMDESRTGLYLGLALIALGAGGIKPLVTAHVADQFGEKNRHRLGTAIAWFYWAVNAGGLVAILLTPWLLERFGPRVAFVVPGVLMLVATVVFWMGRNRFVHQPPTGSGFFKEIRAEGWGAIRRLLPVLTLSAVFWSLYDQSGSAWVLQGQKMDTQVFGMNVLPAQIQAANPFLVLAFVPLFTAVVYPLLGRFIRVTELGKACAGCVLMVCSFLVIAWVQTDIDAGGKPSIAYHLVAYTLLTAAEVMLSVTLIEYTCRQAPPRLKSLGLAAFLLSVSAGNLFTAGVNYAITRADGSSRLAGADYFLFFSGMMAVTSLAFGVLAATRKPDLK